MSKYYITTTLPYVNADPHIGFALEIVQADILARYHKICDDEIIFNTGTDEHGQKIYRASLAENKDPKVYADEYAAKFENLKNALNLSYTNFIRTTDDHHIKAAQKFWKRCEKNGDIYIKNYKIKYCVGCELEKTESELVDERCPIHPNLELEIIEEENYFFKFSKYQKPLLDFYDKNPEFVIPNFRLNEIKQFVKEGLNDFSISRLKEKMSWGIPVPDDEKHVMYVWFDALINYVSTLGWPNNVNKFKEFWGTKENPRAIQLAGKDNLRQQSAIWQAMLLSAQLPNSKQIIIHGFITKNDQKISKSLGNTVNPFEIVKKYGTDALRYYLAKEIHPFEDSDFTWEKFKIVYNADLANGLGNLVARVAKLIETNSINTGSTDIKKLDPFVSGPLNQYRFDWALEEIWKKIKSLDTEINKHELWKEPNKKTHIFVDVVEGIRQISFDLKPFLPETAEKIEEQFRGPQIKSQPPLFPRI